MITATALGEQQAMSKRNDKQSRTDERQQVEGESLDDYKSIGELAKGFPRDLNGLPIAARPSDDDGETTIAEPTLEERQRIGAAIKEGIRTDRERAVAAARDAGLGSEIKELSSVLETLDGAPLQPLVDGIAQAEHAVTEAREKLDRARTRYQGLLDRKKRLAVRIDHDDEGADKARMAELLASEAPKAKTATELKATAQRAEVRSIARDMRLLMRAVGQLDDDLQAARTRLSSAQRALRVAIGDQIRA